VFNSNFVRSVSRNY